MATVTDKRLVDEIIANDGFYSDDPRVGAIYEVTTFAQTTAWVLCYVEADLRGVLESPTIENYRPIFLPNY